MGKFTDYMTSLIVSKIDSKNSNFTIEEILARIPDSFSFQKIKTKLANIHQYYSKDDIPQILNEISIALKCESDISCIKTLNLALGILNEDINNNIENTQAGTERVMRMTQDPNQVNGFVRFPDDIQDFVFPERRVTSPAKATSNNSAQKRLFIPARYMI